MSQYTFEEISKSFYAIQAFLQTKNLVIGNSNELVCKFSFENPKRSYTHTLETECREFIDNPSFILHSDTFKSEGYYKPVWSSYNLFSWDEDKEELTVELNNKKYSIKHT